MQLIGSNFTRSKLETLNLISQRIFWSGVSLHKISHPKFSLWFNGYLILTAAAAAYPGLPIIASIEYAADTHLAVLPN